MKFNKLVIKNTIKRNRDIIYKKEDLEILFKFKKFPVFMGTVLTNHSDDLLADMNWYISRSSGIIQLNPLLPLDIIYSQEHGSGCVGAVWEQHHREFSKFINKFSPKNVLEIGGGHGILSQYYMEIDNIDWTIIEPNPNPGKAVKARYIQGFFDDKFIFDQEVDTIIHSHVLEHIYEPDKFLSDLNKFLNFGKKLIFSIPNMEVMLKRKYNNCLNFEHTTFLSEPYIEYLLNKNNFAIDEKIFFLDDHSIFYSCTKKDLTYNYKLPLDLYSHNKKIYEEYINYHKDLIDDLNTMISKIEKDSDLYLFGAHIFAQYLIAFGLNTENISYILDNDPNKHDKRLYGTSLKVKSPLILKESKNPYVILKAGVYNFEIKSEIYNKINPNVTFLE